MPFLGAWTKKVEMAQNLGQDFLWGSVVVDHEPTYLHLGRGFTLGVTARLIGVRTVTTFQQTGKLTGGLWKTAVH